jgi:xylitol oxidase
VIEVNWAGTHAYRAARIHRPASVEQVQEIVAAAPRIRVLGSRHSFTDVGDSAELVSLERLPADVVIDRERMTVTVGAGVTYGELAGALNDEGLALHNLASLPHISVGGAIATATHGSGDGNGNLATAVAGLTLVASDGELIDVARGDPDFDGFVVGLGALGAVVGVTLDVEQSYEIRQRVFEGLEWDALYERFDAIAATGYSVSVFSRWGGNVEQVWVKSRVDDAPEEVRDELFGAVAATIDRHPIIGLDPVNCTPQLGVAGLWSDRLPHFRMGFTPSKGDEIQSEFFVPRGQAIAAVEAMRGLGDRLEPLLLVSEIRTMAADRLWMSPQCGQATAAFHFTWKREPEAVRRALAEVEAALRPFGARPHWGKAFVARAADVAPLYGHLADFIALMERLDPRGAFRNAWLEERVIGS